METINNLAASAAKVVWGESKPSTEEPISGKTGDVSKGEPYDAGNMEPAIANTEEPISGQTGDVSKGEPYDAGNIEPASAKTAESSTVQHNYETITLPIRKANTESTQFPQTTTEGTETKSAALPEKTENTESFSTKPVETGHETGTRSSDNNDNSDLRAAARFAKETGTAVESKDTPNNPSADLKAKSYPADTSMGQGDTRSPEDPMTHPKSAPLDVDDSKNEEGLNEAPKLDGPGPKPLQEVAKERGGDAGNSSSSVDTNNKMMKEEKNKAEKERSEGTGEEYVRSSGLKADGGDFDATNPGAGREADRLLEQKGLHNPTDPNSKDDDGSDSHPTSEKKSLGRKIKEKLHRH